MTRQVKNKSLRQLSNRHLFPTLEGVGVSRVHVPAGNWPTTLAFLCERFPGITPAIWHTRFERQRVLDQHGQPLSPDSLCRQGEVIHYYRELEQETAIPFRETILYRNDHLLVVDKPHFLPVTPVGRFVQESLLVRLKRSTGIDTLTPVHRIDKDTAGLVLFSVNPTTRDAYQSLFRSRAVHKTYHAIAPLLTDIDWPFCYRSRLIEDADFFRTQEVDGEPNSETHIHLLAVQHALALYALQPVTGRKHQLRVHMNALGAPIYHDPLYPAVVAIDDGDFSQPLQLLAKALAFTDPVTGRAFTFESDHALNFPTETTVIPLSA
jgi:tRNA pseudouridine32 synthase/23S rRNA pseudouridine746 synthase